MLRKLRAGVVALQIDRARADRSDQSAPPVQPRMRLVVDDLLAVEDDRGVAVDQGDVQRLPFAGRLLGGLGRGDPAVDRRPCCAESSGLP